jgi:hypothetical protein
MTIPNGIVLIDVLDRGNKPPFVASMANCLIKRSTWAAT